MMGSSGCSGDGIGMDWDDQDDEFHSSDHSDSGKDCTSGSGHDGDYGIGDDHPNNLTKDGYSILTEEDIKRIQDNDISQISAVLFISKQEACLLLRYYNWSVTTVHENWFSDEKRVREDVGLVEGPIVQFCSSKKRKCGICFEIFNLDKIAAAACGHPYCIVCWQNYISTSINDGPGCLKLRCPDPSCHAAIGLDMVNDLVNDVYKQKYQRYLVRSFVEDNRLIKWCPAPDCEYAITLPERSESYDVNCRCLYGFCWKCREDAHRPLDCETVAKWILKNNSESENTNWILAYTKPCPKCRRPIEKNMGCMHMTCTQPCYHQFCWLCLGSWKEHCTKGGNACNGYKTNEKKVVTEDERKMMMAKKALERYTHYYERWAANLSSRRKALSDLHQMQTVHLGRLSHVQQQCETELKFLVDAWHQIVECRRVLMLTYIYGYYLPEEEDTKRQFFEYLQGQAESNLERLHLCLEKELENYLKVEEPSKDFSDFRSKLYDLTIVTRNYFENLVTALENDLNDVNSSGSSKKAMLIMNTAGSSKEIRGTKRKKASPPWAVM